MSTKRWSAWELSEAFHLAHAADFVVKTELLDDKECSVEDLAARMALDPHLLECLLEFLARRTDLVVRGPEGFRNGPGLGPSEHAVIDQYLGAYGPNAIALPKILSSPSTGRAIVDRGRHAVAFARMQGPGQTLLPNLLRKLGLRSILDLGCGAGGLLIEMARHDTEFRGFGMDASPAMIHAAEQRSRASRIREGQVRFCVADATKSAAKLPYDVVNTTEAVVAASMLNELFHPDAQTAVQWLKILRDTLPDRVLVVVDYYGVLGHSPEPPPRRALHDWIQAISSQGIPPPDLDAWESVYHEAGCELLHAVEDSQAGVFIHFIRLTAADRASTGLQ